MSETHSATVYFSRAGAQKAARGLQGYTNVHTEPVRDVFGVIQGYCVVCAEGALCDDGYVRANTLSTRPGYQVWVRGGTRQQMQDANRSQGRPCYCASLWSGHCDFCSGLAQPGDDRWEGMLREQRAGLA